MALPPGRRPGVSRPAAPDPGLPRFLMFERTTARRGWSGHRPPCPALGRRRSKWAIGSSRRVEPRLCDRGGRRAARHRPRPAAAAHRGRALRRQSGFGRVLEKLGFADTGLTGTRHSCARGGEATVRLFAYGWRGRRGAGGLAAGVSPARLTRAADLARRLGRSELPAGLIIGDQRAVVLVPRVEAGQEEGQPRRRRSCAACPGRTHANHSTPAHGARPGDPVLRGAVRARRRCGRR